MPKEFDNAFLQTIDAPEEDYLYIAPSQIVGAGQGLYTAIDIYPDEIIAIFKGEILQQEEASDRQKAHIDDYFMHLLDGTILDTQHTAGFAKYANDTNGPGKTKWKNNARITLNDDEEVCLVANKKIKPMQEIFCSYGTSYWESRNLRQ